VPRTNTVCRADRAAVLEREDALSTRRGGATMAELSAYAALLRTLDVRCDVLVAGANHDTLMVDPYAREMAGAIERFVSAPSSRSQS
jgi:hypothetical protein